MNNSHKNRGYEASKLSGLYVAYHYFIDGDGTLTKVRSDTERTEHTSCGMDLHKCTGTEQDINGKSIAIALAGDFQHERPTRRQVETMIGLVNVLQQHYNIESSHIIGHREASPTACPGENIMNILFHYRNLHAN